MVQLLVVWFGASFLVVTLFLPLALSSTWPMAVDSRSFRQVGRPVWRARPTGHVEVTFRSPGKCRRSDSTVKWTTLNNQLLSWPKFYTNVRLCPNNIILDCSWIDATKPLSVIMKIQNFGPPLAGDTCASETMFVNASTLHSQVPSKFISTPLGRPMTKQRKHYCIATRPWDNIIFAIISFIIAIA